MMVLLVKIQTNQGKKELIRTNPKKTFHAGGIALVFPMEHHFYGAMALKSVRVQGKPEKLPRNLNQHHMGIQFSRTYQKCMRKFTGLRSTTSHTTKH